MVKNKPNLRLFKQLRYLHSESRAQAWNVAQLVAGFPSRHGALGSSLSNSLSEIQGQPQLHGKFT